MITTPPIASPDAPAVRTTGWHQFEFLPHLVFLALTLSIMLYMEPSSGLAALSLTSCGFAVVISLRQGGSYLVPSSVFFIASGVFIGGAAYYLGRVDTAVAPVDLRNAAGLALVTTIAMSLVTTVTSLIWRLHWPNAGFIHAAPGSRTQPPRQWELRGVAMVALSQLPPAQDVLGPLATAFGVAGVLMVSLSAASRRLRLRWKGDLVIVGLAIVAPVVWVQTAFTGGGRITIAGMFVAAFMGWNLIRPQQIQKVLVILAIPVFLFFAGRDRLGGEGDSGSVVGDGDGLASVYSPLETFGIIIEPKSATDQALLGPRHGATFVNALVLPVPRSMWDDKPDGFGRELVGALQIEGMSEEHSEAGLIQGEWYANFSYWGLALMVPVIGWFMAALDRVHCRLVASKLRSPSDWWIAVALLCAVSSLADLYWVGTFTWFSRGGLAALMALAVSRVSLARRRRLPHRLTSPIEGD